MPAELSPSQLRRSYDPAALDFATTVDVRPANSIIGQLRGVRAIEFGLDMKRDGFNIFVLGETGTGRATAIQHFVETRAVEDPPPADCVYVHNFADPYRPLAITFPSGTAVTFRDALSTLINQLRGDIAEAFDNREFRDAALEVQHELKRKRDQLFQEFQGRALQQDAVLLNTDEGFAVFPARNGRAVTEEEYNAFSDEELAAWVETHHNMEHELNEAMHQSGKLEVAAQQELAELRRRVASSVVDGAAGALKEAYRDHPAVAAYLDQLHQDIIDNVDLFRNTDGPQEADNGELPERFRRYQVNVLADHSQSTRAPVVVELEPTVPRLLGRLEHEVRSGGAVVTDFTLIRPGALHAANGGYLVLRASDLFAEPGSWEALKRALVGRMVHPDDPATRGGTAVRTLDPQPFPLDTKVILIGTAGLYYALHEEDEDFQTIFKVMADFDEQVDRTADNEREYAGFIATRVLEEDLLHLDQAAVGRVIEYGSRLAGTQNKLSTRFGHIADLVREAAYWATEAGHDVVSVDDIETAIDHREFLSNRIETRLREGVRQGQQLVSTEGAVVGQINGLTVMQIGRHVFGHPSRLTARTYVGKEGVVQIDREAELAGPLHNKGLLTLIGYLGGQYATDMPLSLSAQITFEQNYGGVEGDSASSTELYALLSSLSGVPLRQGVAVTGSVNQAGEIQAIGGVTEKVEGWFAVCQEHGLTGDQGVMIPVGNVQDLMLRVAVVRAVEEGRFHIWAVNTVDEGLEVLTGRKAAEVHAAAKRRLRELGQALHEYEEDDD